MTLGALITLDVHARDVVQQLVDANVTHTTDFEWASQLRYYWRDNVWVEMVQACIAYGYEYLGNTPRYACLICIASTLSDEYTLQTLGKVFSLASQFPTSSIDVGVKGYHVQKMLQCYHCLSCFGLVPRSGAIDVLLAMQDQYRRSVQLQAI